MDFNHPQFHQPHYLTAHYTTRQLTGIRIDARCTCGAKLWGSGPDRSAALIDLCTAKMN
jgi:hypothetical protein